MLTLGNLTLFLLFLAAAAWLWHSHGVRERALLAVKAYCKKMDIELLDGNVAFRRMAVVRDARGQRRLAREYSFEFTGMVKKRNQGRIYMYGRRAGPIQTDVDPFPEPKEPEQGRVIQMDVWRRCSPFLGFGRRVPLRRPHYGAD